MGIGIMKRVRNKIGKFLHKNKKNEVPQYDKELDKQPVCGNCKHFKRVGYNGVVGVCTHEKALHHTIANKLDTYGKPTTRGYYLCSHASFPLRYETLYGKVTYFSWGN